MGVVLHIVLPIVAGVLVVIVVPLLMVFDRKSRRAKDEMAAEPALRGPESGVYRGSTGSYSHVSGNGQIALTADRLIFRKLLGKHVDVPLTAITSVSTAKTFNGAVRGGRTHLVVHTRTGDLGYYVTDP
jgi:hypothetical protein